MQICKKTKNKKKKTKKKHVFLYKKYLRDYLQL